MKNSTLVGLTAFGVLVGVAAAHELAPVQDSDFRTVRVVAPIVEAPPSTLHIDTFGDSIVAQCGGSPIGGFCAPLQQMLAAAGVTATFTNHAVAGTDCGYTSSNVATWLAADRPDLVILDCGTNQDTSTAAAITTAGNEWRTIVETDHAYGALTLLSFVQYSNETIQDVAGRGWLEPSEERFNDQVVDANLHYYQGFSGWLASNNPVDFQQVPSDSLHTLRRNSTGGWDGIHPTPLGYGTYAALIYRELRNTYNLSDSVPQPCGMTGLEARGPSYEQYIDPIVQCN